MLGFLRLLPPALESDGATEDHWMIDSKEKKKKLGEWQSMDGTN